jgi:universal stress protein E
MFRNILVVARGASPDQPALQRALLCTAPGARLVLLDVVHEPLLDGYLGNTVIYEPLRARVVAERRAAIEALAASVTARGFEAVGQAVWEYPLDEVVAKHARTEGADLVVVAPPDGPERGLTPGEWRLVTSCPVPVLVPRGAPKTAYRKIVAAVDPFHSHSKPADLDVSILALARRLAERHGATVTAAHCYTPPEFFGVEHAPGTRGDERNIRREALERLVSQAGLPKSAARLASGAPAHVLLRRMAEAGEADLIVMGALARGRFEEWLTGSTAERVLNAGGADVLAVKAKPER